MKIDDATIQRLLWEKKLLTQEQIEQAVLLAPSLGKTFVETLLFKNFIPEVTLGKMIAETLGVEYISLTGRVIDHHIITLVPEDTAIAHQIIPFDRTATQLHLAMADPSDFEIINFLERKVGLVVKPYFTFPGHITSGLTQYKQDIRADVERLLNPDDIKETDLAKIAEDVPTIKMLDTIIEYAVVQNASDIHLEAQESNSLIRFRIDGFLHDILILDKKVQTALVARIKYLSDLKIDEHRLPQDGRFKYEHLGDREALRVSILPAFYGESVVLRLLPESTKTRTLEELGFAPANIAALKEHIKFPNGIILLTGPTGSGKTTTLYSLLEMLNKPEVKITTIEDPVEYSVPRVSQTQVNLATGLDFAKGLRAVLRHDPNIIMVGEIRDHETADISINAALTGHLVLSTLHTNDATSSIPRLIDLGIEPFLLTATLRVIVAQRLVRKLCVKCAQPVRLTKEAVSELSRLTNFSREALAEKTFFKPGENCPECTDGYKHRIGIHEVFVIDEYVKEFLLTRPSDEKIRRMATERGMYNMIQDGISKAAAGITTIEEIFREAGRED